MFRASARVFARLAPVARSRIGSIFIAKAPSSHAFTTSSLAPNLNNTSSTLKSSHAFIQRRSFASYPDHSKLGMPALSPTMTQGNIAKWKKKEGDKIKPGDVIAEIETDKATMDFEATEEGYLAKILVPDGSRDVPVNNPIAIIANSQSDVAKFKDFAESSAAAQPSKPSPAPSPSSSSSSSSSPPPAPSKPSSSSNLPPHREMGMPALSPTMTQGNIAKWRKKEGDQIKPGDVIAEVETDKATMEFESTEDSFLAKILVKDGSKDIPINTPIAILVDKKDDIAKFKDYDASSASKPAAASTPPPSSSSSDAAPASVPAPSRPSSSGDRVFASPLARKIAAETGVDLKQVNGTGPNDRIIKADVVEFAAKSSATATAPSPKATAAAAAQAPAAGAPAAGANYQDIPLTQVRRVIAQRLTQSKQTIPHYYLTMECRIDELMKVRAQLNADGKVKLSVNDFVVKASALALRKVPTVNSSWTDDAIRQYNTVDINIAVSTDRGLFIPLIRDSDKKGLSTIASQVKDLAEKSKSGKVAVNDLQVGTFTISNLGMFGIKNFAAVINPPQAAILAVGTAEKRMVPKDSKDVTPGSTYDVATVLTVTLSCDHRVIDGAVGAEWLQAFKDLMENPLKMLL